MNELILPSAAVSNVLAEFSGEETGLDLLAGGAYQPIIRLFHAKTELCGEGKIGINHYGLLSSKTDVEDLGKTPLVVPLALRAYACFIDQDTKKVTMKSFREDSDTFRHIQQMFVNGVQGALCGPQFLMWLPDHKKFGTFHCGNKSQVNSSGTIQALKGRLSMLDSKTINGKYGKWQNFTIKGSSQPFTEEMKPGDDLLRNELQVFYSAKNAPESTQEEPAAPAAPAGRDR